MELNPAVLFRWAVQGFFILGAVTFIIQWLVPRWRKFFKQVPLESHSVESDENREPSSNAKQKAREKLQQHHLEKASSYMERVMLPREEAKRKQKEEEFERFTGPAWKGKGQPLGGDVEDDSQLQDTSANQQAARRRRVQEPVKHTAQAVNKEEPKIKRIITLPDEPSEGDKNSVTVRLRTPYGRNFQRSFLHTTTVQVLLDYMMTCGFRQAHYTLSTTYPRQNLATCVNKTLWEMGFQRQITLNVEEKDEEQ